MDARRNHVLILVLVLVGSSVLAEWHTTKNVQSDCLRSTPRPMSDKYTQFIYLQDVRYGSIVPLRFGFALIVSLFSLLALLLSNWFRLGSVRSIRFGWWYEHGFCFWLQ
jgi:hypothetical protein